MCIAYGRLTFIKRTEGRCAAQLGAYLARVCLEFEGSCAREAEVFDYSEKKQDHIFHEVMLPKGASEKFKDVEFLWNYVAKIEKRVNAQESFQYVLALPKEAWIKKEELFEMTRLFAEKMFLSKGLITQVDIHWKDGNPHAHFHGVQRTLSEDGEELSEDKYEARKVLKELAQMRQSKTVQSFFDCYFESKGWDLRCDLPGIIPQIHLGQEGSWGRALDLFLDNRERIELNSELAKNPKHVLQHISKFHSVFSADDVNRFIEKHTPEDFQEKVKRSFWNQTEIIQMIDQKTGEKIDLFSTKDVILEENRLERVLSSLKKRETLYARGEIALPKDLKFSLEQKEAYEVLTRGHGVAVLQGYAGTGKSYVLKAVSEGFLRAGTSVIALGADNAAANALREKGLDATNVFRFLYQKKFQNLSIPKNSVFILDEAGKLDNSTFLEFMKMVKRNKGVVFFSGDTSQIPAVQRGGAFDHTLKTCKTATLSAIQRQEDLESRNISLLLAKGDVHSAIDKLSERNQIHFSQTRAMSMTALAKKWAQDHADKSADIEKSVILVATNKEMHTLNELVRQTCFKWGELSASEERGYLTNYGHLFFAKGDLIVFRGNNSRMGVFNGLRGRVLKAEEDHLSVEVTEGEGKSRLVTLDPKKYNTFHHGYAVTDNFSQGGTWDKSYVLHAPHRARQAFYVVATRHRKNMQVFVSQTETSSLEHLKWQLEKDSRKSMTLAYNNLPTLRSERLERDKEEEIAELKGGSFGQKIRGHVKGALSWIDKKIDERVDTRENEVFYNYRTSVKLETFDTSKEVNTAKTAGEMAEKRDPEFSLDGETLNAVNAEKLFHAFFEAAKEASTLRGKAVKEAKELGLDVDALSSKERSNLLPSWKSAGELSSKRNAIGKALLEKHRWDGVNPTLAYGEDYEKQLLSCTEKFDNALSSDLGENKEGVLKLWKDAFDAGRACMQKVRLDSAALLKEEKKHPDYAKGRQLSYRANWISYAILGEGGKLSTKRPPTLPDETAERLEKSADTFRESLKPFEILKGGEQGKVLEPYANRYMEIHQELSGVRRKVASEILDTTLPPEKCASFKEMYSKFEGLGAMAAKTFEIARDEGISLKEEFSEKGLQIEYQAEKFEKNYKVISPFTFQEIKGLQEEAKRWTEAQKKAFPLMRETKIESVLLGMPENKVEGFGAAKEAKSQMEMYASILVSKAEKLLGEENSQNLLEERVYKQAKSFERIFSVKSPLKEKSDFKDHPFVKDYVRLVEEISETRKQMKIERETEKTFSAEKHDRIRSLDLQREVIAKKIFETLGEEKIAEVFTERGFKTLSMQCEKAERVFHVPDKSEPLPSYIEAQIFGSYYKPHTQEQEERHLFHKEKKWTSLVPDEEKYPSLSPRSNETVRHAYRNEEGKLLFYVVRIEETVQGQKEKKTPPLSFGMEEGGRPKWKWKGFDFGEEKRTLYNLHLLKEHPKADVVIVEGEKAADAAAEKMQSLGRENMIAVSWIGGSKAVSKTDWTPLAGRNVLIWPDNDKAGFDAAKQIERELFRMYHMEKEIRTIDTKWLKKNFEKGWDLADPFPKGLKQNDLKNHAKGYEITFFMSKFLVFSGSWSSSFEKRLQLADIGSSYLFGRRDTLEKEIGEMDARDQNKLLKQKAFELIAIVKKEEKLLQKFENDPILQVSQETKQHLARQCTLFEARNGREATLSEMQTMKSVIEEAQGQINSVLQKDKALEPLQECAKQRMLESFCTKALDRGSFSIPESKDLQKDFGREMQEVQKTQQREMEIEQQKQLEKSLNRGRGFGIGD